LNIVATGITFSVNHDVNSGISTLRWDANPRVAITTGALGQNLVGLVTSINFVGALVTVTGSPTGIATVNISPTSIGGSLPGLPFNSLQFNNNGAFNGVSNSYYDNSENKIHFGSYSVSNAANSLTITNDGKLGLSTYSPTAKVEIVADNETSLYIKSTSGSDVVRIENASNDTTPFIIDSSGNVGINTGTVVAALDVVGNAAITGAVRIYESDRSNYVGLGVTGLGSNITFTLPTGYGLANQVLTDNGSGVLSWTTVSRQNVTVGTGLISSSTTSGGITTTTISNSGITSVTAGIGISVTYTGTSVEVAATNNGATNLYPFTTRGFSIPF
jgi:hypothetical protein